MLNREYFAYSKETSPTLQAPPPSRYRTPGGFPHHNSAVLVPSPLLQLIPWCICSVSMHRHKNQFLLEKTVECVPRILVSVSSDNVYYTRILSRHGKEKLLIINSAPSLLALILQAKGTLRVYDLLVLEREVYICQLLIISSHR